MSFKRTIQRSIHKQQFRPWPRKVWPEGHARADSPAGPRKHRRRMRPFLGQQAMGVRAVDRSLREFPKARESWRKKTLPWLVRILGKQRRK